MNDTRHLLHGHTVKKKRLKARSTFMHDTDTLINSPSTRRIKLCSNYLQSAPDKIMQTSREASSGTWLEWKCLNRLRTKMGRCKHTMKKWKYIEDDDTMRECKNQIHLLKCPQLQQTCSMSDLIVCNDTAIGLM